MSEPVPTVPELLELLKEDLDDTDRLETLRAAEAAATSDPSMRSSYLGDIAGAARCLARAGATAKTVDDHCSVAAGLWMIAGDREAAEVSVQHAIALAEDGTTRQAWWTIFNTYAQLDDVRKGADR